MIGLTTGTPSTSRVPKGPTHTAGCEAPLAWPCAGRRRRGSLVSRHWPALSPPTVHDARSRNPEVIQVLSTWLPGVSAAQTVATRASARAPTSRPRWATRLGVDARHDVV
jgi:hypothetical protein